MRLAIAAIPDEYLVLAMSSNGWFTTVSLLAMVIAGLQAFERAVIRAIEHLIIWPFVQIRRTVYHSDPLMVEFFSATSAGLCFLSIFFGRDNSVAHQLMLARIPEWAWATWSGLLCVGQFWAAAHGALSQRATACVFACAFWVLVSLVLILRVGFSLAHVFSLPMVLACWLAIFMLIAKGTNGSGSTGTTTD